MADQQSKVLGIKLTVPIEFEVIYDPTTAECAGMPLRIEAAEAKLRTPDDNKIVGRIGGAAGGALVADVCGFQLAARPLEAWRAVEEQLSEHTDVWQERKAAAEAGTAVSESQTESLPPPTTKEVKKSSDTSTPSSKDHTG
jgi:acyl-coenzyme A thioesterase PaaI-like protein